MPRIYRGAMVTRHYRMAGASLSGRRARWRGSRPRSSVWRRRDTCCLRRPGCSHGGTFSWLTRWARPLPHTAGVTADPFTVAPGLIASPAVATGRRGARLREALVALRLGEAVGVRNGGGGGWDPLQYLMEARRRLGREGFDLVIVAVYLGNDVVSRRIERYPPRTPVEDSIHRFRVPQRLRYREFVDAVLYPINDFLQARSQLFNLLKQQAATLRMRLGLTAVSFPADLLRREANSPRWAVTAQICRDIARLARAHGAPTLFVLTPAPFPVD